MTPYPNISSSNSFCQVLSFRPSLTFTIGFGFFNSGLIAVQEYLQAAVHWKSSLPALTVIHELSDFELATYHPLRSIQIGHHGESHKSLF